MTSSLVHASNTLSAGARYVRSMRRVWSPIIAPAPGGAGRAALPGRARGAPRRRRRPSAGAPPPARRRCARSGSRAGGPALGGRLVGQGVCEVRRLVVLVVEVPPHVRLRLRVALRRVLPDLLAPERGHVEVGPGRAEGLVTAAVDEVC